MVNKNNFTKDDYGWELKDTATLFLGKPIEIRIDTKSDSEHPDQEIFDEQIETVNIILANWQEITAIIEKEILAYQHLSREELLKVMDESCVWLGMDSKTNQPWKDHRWSFTLGVTESEDFGWHVEFQGDMYLETWAGG